MINIKRPLILLLALTIATVPLKSQAAISQLVFTTDPQTIAPGMISEVITVQTQDGSGGEAKMEETGDVSFVSSSATGQFVNENGNPVSETMSIRTAKRNFYYRDSTVGTPTLTVTVTARTSGTVWSASQTITVGAGVPVTDDDNDTNSTTTPPTTTQQATGGNQTLSAHENPVPISQVASAEPFKIGAGRPRLASVHGPIIFRAESSGAVPANVRYQWSFGDGSSAVGEKVTHIYHFPGEYNVVLNAVAAGQDSETAVGRTTVLVIQPIISFGVPAADRVEVINRSARELNLGNWRIIQGAASFTFPSDTIVAVGKGTVVPVAYLGFSLVSNMSLTLSFPDATVAALANVSHTALPIPPSASLEALTQLLRQLSAKLAALDASRFTPSPAGRAAAVKSPIFPAIQNTQTQPTGTAFRIPSTTDSQLIESEAGLKFTTSLSLSATVATIPVPKPPSFFTRFKHWFGK